MVKFVVLEQKEPGFTSQLGDHASLSIYETEVTSILHGFYED